MKPYLAGATSYRPDIDGLRAVAVLAVLAFHAFPSVFVSGFVGVDIFFVISGYLITRILLAQLSTTHFSLRHFYAQRIKRIFPALATVLIFCLCVGWIALTSGEYKQLGRYTAGGAVFLDNILFWRDAGYFDTEANTKPLLHLWSLAIEEQFYVVWPLLLWLCHRLPRRRAVTVVVVGGLVIGSLCYSYLLVQQDRTADFYSPLSRAWELAVGALLAAWKNRQAPPQPNSVRWYHQLVALTGGALFIAAFVLINESRAFPGLWALLPTLGAACLIAAGSKTYFNQYVLSNRLLVWIGLISYPLYLWHWPLLTLARIFAAQTPSVEIRLALLIASFVLAFLTYRFIERPIRHPKRTAGHTLREPFLIAALCVVMLGLLGLGYAITRHDGLPWRLNSKLGADPSTIVLGADRHLLRHTCGLAPEQASAFEWCLSQNKSAPPQFAVIGDSKAEALYYGLAREADANQNWMLMGSFPAFHLQPSDPPSLLEKSLRRLDADPAIRVVILANSFRHIFSTDKETRFINKPYATKEIEQLAQSQNEIVRRLQSAGKRVVFLIDNPTLPEPTSCIQGEMTQLPVLRHLLTRSANPHCSIRHTDHLAGTAAYQQFVQALKRLNPELLVFDPLPLLCDTANNVCTYFDGSRFLYGYGDHLSDWANSKIAKQLLPLLRH